ncbi:MAG: hypothetical protein K2X86_15670 [Cytophagaceae bacterium]|nr:hypothetical protein [Cytophagaceae bacterium]
MKNLILGTILSLFITAGSVVSVNAGLNFPDEKKKKCCKTEGKECKDEKKKSSCDKTEKKDCSKKDKKTCEEKKAQ